MDLAVSLNNTDKKKRDELISGLSRIYFTLI